MRTLGLILLSACSPSAPGPADPLASAPGADPVVEPSEDTVPPTPDADSAADAPGATAPCADRAVGTGIGGCAPDFTLLDADGAPWTLYEHAGDVILVDFSAMWCPHCRNLADDLQALHEAHAAEGLTVVTVLHEDLASQPPDADDLRQWSAAFGLTHAVLTDPDAVVEGDWGGFYQPNVVVVGRDLVVDWRSTGGAATSGLADAVRAAL